MGLGGRGGGGGGQILRSFQLRNSVRRTLKQRFEGGVGEAGSERRGHGADRFSASSVTG